MLKIRPISNALQELASKELNEVPSRIPDDINHIKSWFAQQPHLRARTDDQWILTFLRGCKFSLERTKEKFDMYYTMRAFMPIYFTNRDPFLPEIQRVLNMGLFLPLPKTVGDNGPRIIFGRYGSIDTSITFDTLVKTFMMISDIVLKEDDNSAIAGQDIFVDLAGSSLEYLLSIRLSDAKKVEILVEKAYPSRPQSFNLINSSPIYETFYNLARRMASAKATQRLHVYGTNNIEGVYKIIPRSYLPKEYGGECGKISDLTAYWKKKVEDNRDWLLEDEQYGVDETKRLGKSKAYEDLFGIEGSFRKLDID